MYFSHTFYPITLYVIFFTSDCLYGGPRESQKKSRKQKKTDSKRSFDLIWIGGKKGIIVMLRTKCWEKNKLKKLKKN